MDLLESDSSDEADEKVSFKINRNYANNYETWRKKEERQKLIDKYGDDVGDSSSSSDEEEIRSSVQMDKDWLRAYAVVHFQQPRLYKEGEKFFHDDAKPVVLKKKEKTMTLKDHERTFMLEKGGIESDEDDDKMKIVGKSYFEEQVEIKESFKVAVAESDDDDDEDDDDNFLVKKKKTEEEKEKEENEYLEWLKGEKEELEDEEAAAELAPLKAYWNDPNLPEKERVLRDYILNNGYMSHEDDEDSEDNVETEAPDHEKEEEFLEKAEEYEHKYNFRHEEPGGDEIKNYPRVIKESVRTKDTRRAEKRKQKQKKKEQEREQRKEEMRLLRRLQQEEKDEKLHRLQQVANNPNLAYDLEADFDPEEHNKIMQQYFNDDYYGAASTSDQKPVFQYDEAVDNDTDDWWHSRHLEQEGEAAEDGEDVEDASMNGSKFNMDADYDPTQEFPAEKKKKRRGRSSVKKLPLFDPKTKTFDEYMDEYLRDKIDSLPFTYREVLPVDFGLTTEEILKAPERELNSWVSVKKMSQYRSREEEEAEARVFAARSSNHWKKYKLMPSLLENSGDAELAEDKEESEEEEAPKKKKRKKKSSKKAAKEMDISVEDDDEVEEQAPSVSSAPQKKKKKRKKEKTAAASTENDDTVSHGQEEEEEEEDSGYPVKKKKKGKNLKKQSDVTKNAEINGMSEGVGNEEKRKKKKKKKKLKERDVTHTENDSLKLPNTAAKKKKHRTDEESSKQPGNKGKLKKKKSSLGMSTQRMAMFGIGAQQNKRSGKKKKKSRVVDSQMLSIN